MRGSVLINFLAVAGAVFVPQFQRPAQVKSRQQTFLSVVGAVPRKDTPAKQRQQTTSPPVEGRQQFTGQEFVDLLPEDVTQEEYHLLLEEFVAFLNRREGDIVDFEKGECVPKVGPYTVADPAQCDKYWDCSQKGVLTENLCKDGFVYDEPGHSCNHPQRVECGTRTDLQEPIPSPGCPRQNGYFHFPDDPELCGEYVDCVNGLATPGFCSTGLVWSPENLACTLPNQSGRKECIEAARKNEGFTCPETGNLRFGNHDRLADPKDCGKFYVCLPNGDSSPAACDKPLVFDESIGSCKPKEEVEGCEDYEGV